MTLPASIFDVVLGKVQVTIKNHVGTPEETTEVFLADVIPVSQQPEQPKCEE